MSHLKKKIQLVGKDLFGPPFKQLTYRYPKVLDGGYIMRCVHNEDEGTQ